MGGEEASLCHPLPCCPLPVVVPHVAISCRVVIMPPVAVVVPSVALLPLAVVVPTIVVPPVAVIVPPVAVVMPWQLNGRS